jgi:alpha-glucosidase
MGFVDKLEAATAGAQVTFAVQAATAGSHTVGYRYANATGAASTMTVEVRSESGDTVSGPFQVAFPDLADWDTWSTVTGTITLQAGVNLVTVSRTAGDTGAINLNYLEFTG